MFFLIFLNYISSSFFNSVDDNPGDQIILDYNIYKDNYEGMRTDHSFITKGITGDSMDGLLPHISPLIIQPEANSSPTNFVGIFPSTTEHVETQSLKQEKKKSTRISKSKKANTVSKKLNNLQKKELLEDAQSSSKLEYKNQSASTTLPPINRNGILLDYIVTSSINTHFKEDRNQVLITETQFEDPKITLNKGREVNVLLKYLRSANKKLDLKAIYSGLCKNGNLTNSSHTIKRFVNIFDKYYSHLHRAVERTTAMGQNTEFEKINFKKIQFTEFRDLCLLDKLENLKHFFGLNAYSCNIFKDVEKPFYDLRINSKLQKCIKKKEISSFRCDVIQEEIYWFRQEVNCMLISKLPFSEENLKELELLVLKEILKLPKGVDTFMVIQSFMHNLTLENRSAKYKQLWNLLFLIKRFLINKREMNRTEYLHFIIALLSTENIDLSTRSLLSYPFIYKNLFDIRYNLQNGGNYGENLCIILGLLFPYNLSNYYLSLTERHIDQIFYQRSTGDPIVPFYLAPVFDLYEFIQKNDLLNKIFN